VLAMFDFAKMVHVGLRITPDMNSKLNKFAGRFRGLDRSKIMRLALIDFITGSNLKRRELDKFERLQKHGQQIYIREDA